MLRVRGSNKSRVRGQKKENSKLHIVFSVFRVLDRIFGVRVSVRGKGGKIKVGSGVKMGQNSKLHVVFSFFRVIE